MNIWKLMLNVINANRNLMKAKLRYKIKYSPIVFLSPNTELSVGRFVQISEFCSFSGNIRLERYSKIGPHSKLYGTIKVGMGSILVKNATIEGEKGVKIGNYCAIGPNFRAYTTNHDITVT